MTVVDQFIKYNTPFYNIKINADFVNKYKKQQQEGMLQDGQGKTLHVPPGHESYINNMKMLSTYVVK